jgi:NADPH:quinone reductase-like Zn-dependent oxidoreductase
MISSTMQTFTFSRRLWNILFELLLFSLVAAAAACEAPAPAAAPQPSDPAPATMKAVRIHAYGGVDVLRYEDVPRPRPGPGEVLVRVHAAGVNPVDAAIREGRLRERLHSTLPLTLGWDVSGAIEALGPGVTRFRRGDAVFAYLALTRGGGYAEYVVMAEAEAAPKPTSIDHVQAASVPVVALTAWQSLVDKAQLQPGQTVLIHGGSGGVGTMAIQIAKIRGARVIATGSARNLDYLKSLGADEVIDYGATRFEDVVKDVDVVFDLVGKDTQERSWQVIKKGGILVSVREPGAEEKAKERGVRAAYVLVQPHAEQLAEIARLIDAGRIKPVVSETFSLAEVQRAHQQIETRHTRGKLVLRVAP